MYIYIYDAYMSYIYIYDDMMITCRMYINL